MDKVVLRRICFKLCRSHGGTLYRCENDCRSDETNQICSETYKECQRGVSLLCQRCSRHSTNLIRGACLNTCQSYACYGECREDHWGQFCQNTYVLCESKHGSRCSDRCSGSSLEVAKQSCYNTCQAVGKHYSACSDQCL